MWPRVPPSGLRPDRIQYTRSTYCRGVEMSVIGVSAGGVPDSTRGARSATSIGGRSAATCASASIILRWIKVEVLHCGDPK